VITMNHRVREAYNRGRLSTLFAAITVAVCFLFVWYASEWFIATACLVAVELLALKISALDREQLLAERDD